MTAFLANPSAYIIPAVLLCVFAGYYIYTFLDRFGGNVTNAVGTVTGKQYTPHG